MKLEAHDTPSARHFGYCRSFVRLSHNLLLVKNDQGDERVYEVVRQVPMVHERDHSKKNVLKQLPGPTKIWSEISKDFGSVEAPKVKEPIP
ncbi:hypothetical protein B0I72DRAFT_159035 [Yarrowia lipolytica]|uniref:YALI0A13849p n=1 Tax=Yarrowia lipolytica (strain CLIB 122 / E 150) TaxID=284591 RepID=Q6CH16_YARLI|nr:YALI0A13849p [Yarrowia lipolytica CLIB122]RDW32211.1 hypothetical protein B0I72DRAFT_159035 [Yarrowia lipolytica]CAG83975.1 YALI0A13849p [Yarrowia lipolytica CLIB122]|eukprot:XP_500046.1 YALI0A13849p [Yarrowia lipolytica CLIB122]